MIKKNRVIKETEKIFKEKLNKKQLNNLMDYTYKRFYELKEENKKDNKYIKEHTETQIYPAIAMYEGLIKEGFSKKEAYDFLDRCYRTRAKKPAKLIRNILKIPKLYLLIPNIFKKAVSKKFGKKAGFEAKFYETSSKRAKFDMLKCPYYEICKKYGYPEITTLFCHTDDEAYGNMHKNLIWNRTKTIGEGNDICDFDIIIKNKNKNENENE